MASMAGSKGGIHIKEKLKVLRKPKIAGKQGKKAVDEVQKPEQKKVKSNE